MDVAGVAIVAYFLKRTIYSFSDVGRVDAMVTILAFGHNCNFYIGIKEDIGKTFGFSEVGLR
jgi:hypothetical protein